MKKNALIYFIIILMFLCDIALAWNDSVTHPHITRKATERSNLGELIEQNLMLQGGIDERINGKTIIEWLQFGAEMEDDPACRASNHFHDPYQPWVQGGLSDTHWLIDWYCRTFFPFPPEDISSSMVWATGLLNKSGTELDYESIEKNEWDWRSARENLLIYLTGKDFNGVQLASNLSERNQYFTNTLRGLGQVMHLLQDSAVPAHVRNDFSQGHLMVNPGPYYPKNWIGNGFEKRVERNDGREWFDITSIEMNIDPSTWYLADLWDTDQLSYSSAPSDMLSIGLAEYTAMNFFSEYSIFESGFPFPKKEHCAVQPLSPPIDIQSPLDRQYLSSNNGHPGDQIDHLAVVSYVNSFKEVYAPHISSEKIPLGMDAQCYDEYAMRLIPRAIGFSASLLNYFFRER